MGGNSGTDCECGGNEYLQFHGRDQWDYGGVFVGGVSAAAVDESAGGVCGELIHYRDNPVGPGFQLLQLPAEE